MKKLLLTFLLVITGIIQLFSQSFFPDRCIGVWKGQMQIYKSATLIDSVQIMFTVAIASEPNAWIWKTEYFSNKQPLVKDYILRLTDIEKQQYIIDEGDGIRLTNYLFGDKLYCVFETQKILLTSTYEIIGDNLVFEVTSGKKLGFDDREVLSYSVNHVQRVVLKRAP